MGQLDIDVTENINADADHVWSIVGDDFENIGRWAAGINSSKNDLTTTAPSPDAPIGGRICDVGKPLLVLNERLVSYDSDKRQLAHTVTSDKMPGFVDGLLLTWTVAPAGRDASKVTVNIASGLSGIGGAVMGPMMRMQFKKNMGKILADLKALAETGSPSNEKRKALADARR